MRITVRAETELVVREGFGTGDAECATLGEAHDKAIKTAETDATKRALATFGKPFDLSLYVGSRQALKQSDIQRRRTLQRLGPNGRFQVPTQPKPTSVMQMLASAPFPAPDLPVDSEAAERRQNPTSPLPHPLT